VAYLGTNDFTAIECAIEGKGTLDRDLASELVAALCYHVAKAIAALAAYTDGKVDAVVLTGGLAFSRRVVEDIRRRVSFLGPVLVYAGENELEALAMGVRDVLRGEARARTYEG
jgi:butyrate kinase